MPEFTRAPTIETERLRLDAHRTEDLDDCVAMWADPEVVRHIGGRPFARDEVWSKILRYAGLWSLLGYGYFAVRDRATGRFVGEAGLADFHRAMTPSIDGVPEAGWALASWAHGRGLATEAVRAVLAWYEGAFGPSATVCMIDPGHAASVRVAEKCGYAEWQRGTFRGEPTVIYRRGT